MTTPPARDYTRFIVLGGARTGSTVLAFALGSHPAVVAMGEVFNVMRTDMVDWGVEGWSYDEADLRLREEDPVRFLHERVWRPQPSHVRAAGFKLMYVQAEWLPAVTEALAADGDLRILHARRHNLLRLLVSSKIAEQTKLWMEPAETAPGPALVRRARRLARRLRGTPPPIELPPPVVDQSKRRVRLTPDECFAYFREHEAQQQRLARIFGRHPMFDVYYREQLWYRDAVFERAQRFLGVAPRRLKVPLKRQNPEPLSVLIENYDEVAAAIADSPYAPLLNEENYP